MKFTQPVISIQELKLILENPELVILDCSIDKVNQPLDHTNIELIPNSHFLDIENRFSDHFSELPHTLVDEKTFTKECQLLGINQDSIIICYDRWGVYSSPRAWWMFKTMGMNDVYVLNGGIEAWKNAKYETVSFYQPIESIGDFEAKFDSNWYADIDDVLDAIENESISIIDARSVARFNAEVDEPRPGLRKGHIKNAYNLPFDKVLHQEFFKSDTELKTLLSEHLKYEECIFSCGSGITASILALANHQINPKKITKVYDGSWAEWGKDHELPIE